MAVVEMTKRRFNSTVMPHVSISTKLRSALGATGSRHGGGAPFRHAGRWHAVTLEVAHSVVLALSVLLIIFISYDTFRDIPFLESHSYMAFQLVVCMVFIVDFFLELALTPRGDRHAYVRRRWLYLILSIPYLNIIDSYDIKLGADALYFVRFIPLARGGLALVIVLDYIAANRITGLFVSYVSILVLTTYFAALIFYEREHPVNPYISNYGQAFVWCCLQTTTLGSPVMPVTVAGKIISVILSYMGIIMYPLFTVYLSSLILKRHDVLNLLNIPALKVKKAAYADQNVAAQGAEVVHSERKS